MSKILKKPGKSTKKEAKKAKLIQDDSDEEPDKKIFEIDETQEQPVQQIVIEPTKPVSWDVTLQTPEEIAEIQKALEEQQKKQQVVQVQEEKAKVYVPKFLQEQKNKETSNLGLVVDNEKKEEYFPGLDSEVAQQAKKKKAVEVADLYQNEERTKIIQESSKSATGGSKFVNSSKKGGMGNLKPLQMSEQEKILLEIQQNNNINKAENQTQIIEKQPDNSGEKQKQPEYKTDGTVFSMGRNQMTNSNKPATIEEQKTIENENKFTKNVAEGQKFIAAPKKGLKELQYTEQELLQQQQYIKSLEKKEIVLKEGGEFQKPEFSRQEKTVEENKVEFVSRKFTNSKKKVEENKVVDTNQNEWNEVKN